MNTICVYVKVIHQNPSKSIKIHQNPSKSIKIPKFLWLNHLVLSVFSVFSSWLASKLMLTMGEGTLRALGLIEGHG